MRLPPPNGIRSVATFVFTLLQTLALFLSQRTLNRCLEHSAVRLHCPVTMTEHHSGAFPPEIPQQSPHDHPPLPLPPCLNFTSPLCREFLIIPRSRMSTPASRHRAIFAASRSPSLAPPPHQRPTHAQLLPSFLPLLPRSHLHHTLTPLLIPFPTAPILVCTLHPTLHRRPSNIPDLNLFLLNNSFIPKHIDVDPRVQIERWTNAKTCRRDKQLLCLYDTQPVAQGGVRQEWQGEYLVALAQ
jgi:hypothetical protein